MLQCIEVEHFCGARLKSLQYQQLLAHQPSTLPHKLRVSVTITVTHQLSLSLSLSLPLTSRPPCRTQSCR
jgi:hypothetical protein